MPQTFMRPCPKPKLKNAALRARHRELLAAKAMDYPPFKAARAAGLRFTGEAPKGQGSGAQRSDKIGGSKEKPGVE